MGLDDAQANEAFESEADHSFTSSPPGLWSAKAEEWPSVGMLGAGAKASAARRGADRYHVLVCAQIVPEDVGYERRSKNRPQSAA